MLQSVVLLAVLVALAIIDLKTRRLPDWLTLPLTALGLVVTWLAAPLDLPLHILGAAVGFLPVHIPRTPSVD